MRYLFYFIYMVSFYSFGQKLHQNIFFETDKYEIKPIEKDRLNSFISLLDTLTIQTIDIYGYCDDRGSISYNQLLSDKRANIIKNYLLDSEFSENQLNIISGKGELPLNVFKDIGKVRQNNRRVEIVVQAKSSSYNIEKPTTQTILRRGVKVGDKIRLKNIYFKTGYSTIMASSIPTLKEITAILVEKKNIYFTIEGHVCCTHDTYDAIDRKTGLRNLSMSRAKFIYTFLLQQGVEKHRMKYVGLRRKFPLGLQPKLDRRVELLITYVGKQN